MPGATHSSHERACRPSSVHALQDLDTVAKNRTVNPTATKHSHPRQNPLVLPGSEFPSDALNPPQRIFDFEQAIASPRLREEDLHERLIVCLHGPQYAHVDYGRSVIECDVSIHEVEEEIHCGAEALLGRGEERNGLDDIFVAFVLLAAGGVTAKEDFCHDDCRVES